MWSEGALGMEAALERESKQATMYSRCQSGWYSVLKFPPVAPPTTAPPPAECSWCNTEQQQASIRENHASLWAGWQTKGIFSCTCSCAIVSKRRVPPPLLTHPLSSLEQYCRSGVSEWSEPAQWVQKDKYKHQTLATEAATGSLLGAGRPVRRGLGWAGHPAVRGATFWHCTNRLVTNERLL